MRENVQQKVDSNRDKKLVTCHTLLIVVVVKLVLFVILTVPAVHWWTEHQKGRLFAHGPQEENSHLKISGNEPFIM